MQKEGGLDSVSTAVRWFVLEVVLVLVVVRFEECNEVKQVEEGEKGSRKEDIRAQRVQENPINSKIPDPASQLNHLLEAVGMCFCFDGLAEDTLFLICQFFVYGHRERRLSVVKSHCPDGVWTLRTAK